MKGKPSYLLTWLRIPPGPCYETQCRGSFILLSYISLYGNQQAKQKKKKSYLKIKDCIFLFWKPLRQELNILFCLELIFFHFNLQSDAIKEKIK